MRDWTIGRNFFFPGSIFDRSDKVASVGRMLFGTTNTSGADTSQTSTAHHGYFSTMMNEVKAQDTIDNSYKKPNE